MNIYIYIYANKNLLHRMYFVLNTLEEKEYSGEWYVYIQISGRVYL
jgi:hypothetical protein